MVNLGKARVGERIQAVLRVVERTERQKVSGEPFVIFTLGNASGQLDTEPVWSNQLDQHWADGAVRGALVQAVGEIARYDARGASRRQIHLSAPLRVLPRDDARLDEFLPRITEDPARLWERLDKIRTDIKSERLRRVLAAFFDDEPFRLRFERTPASIGGHHAALGGLLLHVWEVAFMGQQMARAMRARTDIVLAGALLHDIGKLEAYDAAWEGFVRTPAGHLIEHVVLGSLMLQRRLAELGDTALSTEQVLELQHLILSHHGQLEFGSPVRPLTLEAEIVNKADDASAKAASISEAVVDDDAFPDGSAFGDRNRLWRVDRRSLWRRTHDWE